MKVMGVVGKGHAPHIRAIEPGDVVVVVGRTGGPKNKVLRAIVTRMRRVPQLQQMFLIKLNAQLL